MIDLFRKVNLKREWSQASFKGASGFSSMGNSKKRFRKRYLLPAFLVIFVYYGFYMNDRPVGAIAAASSVASFSEEGGLDYGSSLREFVRSNHDNLLRMVGADVSALMDAPELVRADLPTVIWQYRKNNCVLDVYFASSSSDVSGAPVVHYEARLRDDGALDGASCVSEMISVSQDVGRLADNKLADELIIRR